MAVRRQRDSWGSISYDARSRTARIRYWAEGPDGYRRRSRTLRNVSRKQAEEARAALMVEHSDDAPCPTVGQVWERWVLPELVRREESGDMSSHTLKSYRGAYANHIDGTWGGVQCDCVRPLEVQQWLMDGKTHNQAQMGRVVLGLIMDKAVMYGLVASNPMRAKYMMPSKSTVSRRDKGVWSMSELGELWRHVHGRYYEAAFILAAFGSCRTGESVGVMADEVSSRTVIGVRLATAPIVRQIDQSSRVTERLKTEWSRRTVVVAGRAADTLVSIARANSGGWLTGNGVGSHVSRRTLNQSWKRDVPKDMYHPMQNLRNSWQTNMRWELGIPPWLIEPMMGHVGEGVTGQHYDRPQVEVFCETLAKAYREHQYDAGWTWLG